MLDTALLGLTIRATLLMAIGLIVARLIERRSATLSHRILAATGLCVALLPLATLLGLRWEWSRPDWLPGNVSLASIHVEDDTAIAYQTAHIQPEEFSQSSSVLQPNSTWNLSTLAVSLWIIGSCFMLVRLGYALRRLNLSLSRCTNSTETLQKEVQSMSRDFRIYDRVQIKLTSRESMPMVCWFGRWILVLPSNIESWTFEVRHATLSHELGHISRRDVWVDYAIQTLSCLLWWHPLIWIMKRTVTRMRELACDEWVLQTCRLSARSYSHALLDVIRRCQVDELQLATPMATTDELESRLRSIASPNRTKKVRRFWLTFCVGAIAVLGLGVAAFKLVNPGSAMKSVSTAGEMEDGNPVMKSGGSIITGLVTYEGNPVAGAKLKVFKNPEGKPSQLHARLETDDQGRYKITDMHPGDRYHFEIAPKGNLMVRNWPYQSPYVQTVGGTDGETIELPDAVLVSNNQALRGVVVDPAGKPVSGITVNANLASGQMLSRPVAGQEPWTQTDHQGRFHLTTLPDEPIELMAYKSNPNGGRIVHPCKLKVGLNDSDIRMVFDPKLGSGIEDLDSK